MKTLSHADRQCEALAEKQSGAISRDQALDCGMTPTSIADRVRSGRWHLVHPSVYRVAGAPVTEALLITAAWLWADEGFVSHRSAARLYELDGISAPSRIELSTYTGKSRSGLLVHRLQAHDRPALRVIGGITVSLPERTLFELAGVIPLHTAGLALDDALRKRLTTLDRVWLEWESRGKRGRRGTKNLRILLMARDDREGLLRSRLEAKMLRILKRIRPYEAVPNFVIRDGTRVVFIDFAYPALKVGIETHGAAWHAGEERWKRDLRRDRWLKGLGWTVLYFSWDDVHLEPRAVEQEIRTFLSRAS